MFSGIGYQEMIVIGVIALMLFGSKLPDMARNLGSTYRDLRRKVDDFQREFRDWERMDSPPAKKPSFTPDDEEKVEPKTPKFIPPPSDEDNE